MAPTENENHTNKYNIEIDVSIACEQWNDALPAAEELCRRAVSAAVKHIADDFDQAEISLVLADDDFIRDLNRRYRNIDRPTNVLSFPGDDAQSSLPGPKLLGDIVIALETVKAEADRDGKKLADHVCHLVVHGVLHLFEFDHQTAQDAENMEAHEIKILSTLDIDNPYAD